VSDAIRTVDLLSELFAGFVAGVIAAIFLLMFVSVFFTELFSSGLLGTVFGVLGYLNPAEQLIGQLAALVGGGLGAYWRYVYTKRRVATTGNGTETVE
jgi:hypothetical protein